MKADLALKSRQAFWETPRNLVIASTALAGTVAAIAGSVGYKIAQTPAPQIVFQPGSIVVSPQTVTPAAR